MISPGILASIVDINGPDARKFADRNTVYVSPTGKDGYLGATPNLPVKTFTAAKNILTRLKVGQDRDRYLKLDGGVHSYEATYENSALSLDYNDNNIFNKNLYIERSSVTAPIIEGSHYFTEDLPVTSNGLIKVKLPEGYSYSLYTTEKQMMLDDDRIFPARFPKEGVFYYAGAKRTVNNVPGFTINDRYTNFCKSLSSLFTNNSNTNPRIIRGGDFYNNVSSITLNSLSSNPSKTQFFFTLGFDVGNVGISIIPFGEYSNYNLSELAHNFCTLPGEFVKSVENEEIFIYIKPYKETTSRFKLLTSVGQGIAIKGAENVVIKDITIRHFYTGATISDYTRRTTLTGCTIEKNVNGIRQTEAANTTLYKNIIFDHISNGIINIGVSGFNCDNNIILYSGTANSVGLDVGGGATALGFTGRGWGNTPNMNTPTRLISATPTTFTLAISSLPSIVDSRSPLDYNFVYDFGGYLEVTSGPLAGERRLCIGLVTTDYQRTATFGIKDKWNLINGYTSPQPGDTVKYVSGQFSRKSSRNKITNNYAKYSGYGVLHGSSTYVDIISGNHFSNSGYGFSNDMGCLYYGFGGGASFTDQTYIYNNLALNIRQTPGLSNGNGLYSEEQGRFITWYNNIIRGAGSSFLSNGMCNTTMYNNIFLDSYGSMNSGREQKRDQFSYTVNSLNIITQSSNFFGISAFNNIWYSASAIMPLLYPELNSSVKIIPMFSGGGTQYASRVVHSTTTRSNDAYRSIAKITANSYNRFDVYFEPLFEVTYDEETGMEIFAEYFNLSGGAITLVDTRDVPYIVNFSIDNQLPKNGIYGTASNFSTHRTFTVPLSSNLEIYQISEAISKTIQLSSRNVNTDNLTAYNYGYSVSLVLPSKVYNTARVLPLTAGTNTSFNIYRNIGSDSAITGWNSNFYHIRVGDREGRPMYEQAEELQRFYVKSGNWVYGSSNMSTVNMSVSTNCGIDGYMYPWQVPVSAWFIRTAPTTRLYPSIPNNSFLIKRSVPLYTSRDNCFYTTLTSNIQNIALSADENAFRGRVCNDINGNTFAVWSSLTGGSSYTNTICAYNSSTIVVNPSAGFETIVPFEGGSIFQDPKLDFTTYQVADDSPVLSLGFKNIDVSKIGLRSDGDDIWLTKVQTLTASVIYGSADWSEFKYGNHNEL
jgi:hypothetical protein